MHGAAAGDLTGLLGDDPLHGDRFGQLRRAEAVEQRGAAEDDAVQPLGEPMLLAIEFGEMRPDAAGDERGDPRLAHCGPHE